MRLPLPTKKADLFAKIRLPHDLTALDRASRAHAWLRERDLVTPEDVRAVAHDCLRHRILMSYEAAADGMSSDQLLDRLLELVAVA